MERLQACAKELKAQKFKPGFDNMDAAAAALWIEINGQSLSQKLMQGNYEVMPAVGFRIAKKNGSCRQLARLTAIDTIVQNSILSVIGEKCEAAFSEHSFAYRKNRGMAQALKRYCEFGSRFSFVLKIDPVSCFDNLDHAVLQTAVFRILKEKATTDLIMKFVKMPLLMDGEYTRTDRGILQGAPLSALLCNIYFDAFDQYLEKQGLTFIRYADDIVIFSDSLRAAEENRKLAVRFLTEQLHLQENKQNTVIDAPAKIQYLGHRFEINKYGLTALAADQEAQAAYYHWHTSVPTDGHRRVDILSDGILRQQELSLAFASDYRESSIPIETTEVINVYSDVIFDSDFFKQAAEHGISVNLFDRNNRLLGHFLPAEEIKSPEITLEQLQVYQDAKKRLQLAKQFLLAAIHNTRLVIRYYHKQATDPAYAAALEQIQLLVAEIKACEDHEQLPLLAARVQEAYYGCFDLFVENSDYSFVQHTRCPPQNEMNALLSFGEAVLNNLIAVEINKTALDVRIGFLHAANRRKEALNLDLAEIFKPLVVDRTVFSMINLRMLQPEHFRHEEDGAVYLTESGKRIFLRQFYDKLDSTQRVKGEVLSYDQLIRREIISLIRYFKDAQQYKPFKQVR
ncbi:MAG: CRISPR-associated endonuclease Cas1 [Faecousia sp.]